MGDQAPRSVRRPARRSAGLLAGLALLVGACGSDGTDAGDPSETATAGDPPATAEPAPQPPPATEAATDDPAAAPPERIVSLSPTHTEMLFAIGAEDRLVAVDEFSDHPPAALELPNDLSGFEPNVEAIAAFEPDLVVTGGDFTGLGEQLAQLGIATWDGPAAQTLDDVYTQIEGLGRVTGREREAEELVSTMQARIADLVDGAPRPDEPLDVYHELDPTFFTADSSTFIGQIYSLFGLRNIADRAEGESFGFPQLNAEFIVSADPDLIFLADTRCCGQSAETVAARPGWDVISAVRNGGVVPVDDDIASRWGPRVVDYVEAIAAALADAVADSG